MPCFEKDSKTKRLKDRGTERYVWGKANSKKRVIGNIYILAGEYAKDWIFWGERSDVLCALFRVCRKMVELKRLI